MATVAVIDFGSFSNFSGVGHLPSKSGRRVEAREFVDSERDRGSTEFQGIVGASPVLQAVLDQVRLVAPTDSTAVIAGETGTAKELVVRAILWFAITHSARNRLI